MKKLYLLVVLMCVLLTNVCAQEKDNVKELSGGQLRLRLELYKFLTDEEMSPKIDEDGDVKFSYDGWTYYLIVNSSRENPYEVTIWLSFSYDEEDEEGGYTADNIKPLVPVINTYKTVKLYCGTNSYQFQCNVFCTNAKPIKDYLYNYLSELQKAAGLVVSLKQAGLGGVDLLSEKSKVFDKAYSLWNDDEFDRSYPLFKLLADMNYSDAYGYMGLAYELGQGTGKNTSLMVGFYSKAVEKEEYWCAYRLGSYYYGNQDYKNAINYYAICSEHKNGFQENALYQLGSMYEEGKGVIKDMDKAVSYYRQSAKCSRTRSSNARYALSRLGLTVDKKEDFVEASKIMLSGMSLDDMYDTGYKYEIGLGSDGISLPSAYAYYKAAADGGHAKACLKMGEIYASSDYPLLNEKLSEKYYSKALKTLSRQADSDSEACYEIANMYRLGNGVVKDLAKAKTYYQKSARMGDKNAAWRYGLICKDEVNYSEAFTYLLTAAEKGQGMAMYEVAKLYENGLGTSQNKDKAIEWYTKCSNSGYAAAEDAKEELKRFDVSDAK